MNGNGTWERISKPEDFPHVTVSAWRGEPGPAFAVGFWQKEFLTGWAALWRALVGVALVLAVIPALIGTGMLHETFGFPAVIAFLIVVSVGGVWLYEKIKNPNDVERDIILDRSIMPPLPEVRPTTDGSRSARGPCWPPSRSGPIKPASRPLMPWSAT